MTNDSENKGRRVTDKTTSDLSAQAVRMAELSGRQDVLALQITNGLQSMRSAIEGTQSEVHRVMTAVERLAAFQADHAQNKETLDVMRRQIDSVSNRMEQLFKDFAKDQDRKWDVFTTDRDARWREHEADNENTTRDLRKDISDIKDVEVRRLREKLIRWTGWGAGVGVLAALIGTGFLYHLNYRFNENEKDTRSLEVQTASHGRELAEIRLYLARGGRLPAPSNADKRNDDVDGKSESPN